MSAKEYQGMCNSKIRTVLLCLLVTVTLFSMGFFMYVESMRRGNPNYP